MPLQKGSNILKEKSIFYRTDLNEKGHLGRWRFRSKNFSNFRETTFSRNYLIITFHGLKDGNHFKRIVFQTGDRKFIVLAWKKIYFLLLGEF